VQYTNIPPPTENHFDLETASTCANQNQQKYDEEIGPCGNLGMLA